MGKIHQPQKLSAKEYRAADEYRAKAEACRTIARQITPPDDKIFVLDMAAAWDRLADEAANKP
ncbi:MAG TPA: hypothetical protein VHT93_04200 [Pseudolabrys sp.]|nr:hypothetical protein [Pseudolabrys sp.]